VGESTLREAAVEDILDECRWLGIKFSKEVEVVAELERLLWKVERQRAQMEEVGENTSLQEIIIERIRRERDVAVEKIK
jgi:hypothetical protein